MSDKPAEERTWWLDRKENVTKVARTLYGVCAVVLLADLVARNHPETQIDSIPFFYGVYGFVGSHPADHREAPGIPRVGGNPARDRPDL